jgi:hypothetical protein
MAEKNKAEKYLEKVREVTQKRANDRKHRASAEARKSWKRKPVKKD